MKLKEFIHRFISSDVPICLWQLLPDTMGSDDIFGKQYMEYIVNGKHINTRYELECNEKASELPVKYIDIISHSSDMKVIDIVLDI